MTGAPVSATLPDHGLIARLQHRPRLFICAALMAAIFFVEPTAWGAPTRALISWNVSVWLFLILVNRMMFRSTPVTIRAYAANEDESQWVLLTIGVVAACAALSAIFAELGPVKALEGLVKVEHLALVGATILSAWTFIHVLFALHYAHEYYSDNRATPAPDDTRGGLRFPCGRAPGYADFLYYSFVIGCACATADIETISLQMRRTTLLHGVVSFFFNTVILALTINIGAGLF